MNVYLDIETIPQQPEDEAKQEIAQTIEAPKTMSKAETIADWHNGTGKYAGAKEAEIEKTYRNTSFDGAKGEICSIAWKTEGFEVESSALDSEVGIIRLFIEKLCRQTKGRQPYFIGQYVAGFDLKFIYQRCVVLGINPGIKIPFHGRHGKDFYCTQQAWSGFGGRMSQEKLCKALGLQGKPSDITGANVWDHYKAGDIKRIEEYNRQDVEIVEAIYKKLNFFVNK